jgi:hypothetical protein
MTDPPLAIVDSPFQLMSLFEAMTNATVDRQPDVLIRAREGSYERLLALGRDLLGELVRRPTSQSECARLLVRRSDLVIGDAYSALFHATLAIRWTKVQRLVLLEDGASALRLHRLLADNRPLTRAHGRNTVKTGLATAAAWRLGRLARRGRVVLSAGLPMSASDADRLAQRSVTVRPHRFEWSRSVRLEPSLLGHGEGGDVHVVLGSSLATDRMLHWRYYRAWLADVLRPGSLFVPHRREPSESPAVVEAAGAKTFANPELPVELLLRDVVRTLDVDCLSTTAAITLPLVRGERPTIVRCVRPPHSAWARDEPEMCRLVEAINAANAPDSEASSNDG